MQRSDWWQANWWTEEIFLDNGVVVATSAGRGDYVHHAEWPGLYQTKAASFSTHARTLVGNTIWPIKSAATIGVEGYADYEAWAIFYGELVYDQADGYTTSPYDGTVPPGYEADQSYIFRLMFKSSHSEALEIHSEFIDDMDDPEVSPIQCEIWDFNGEPVFMCSIYNYQKVQGSYGDPCPTCYVQYFMVFGGEIYWSEQFEVPLGLWKHEVANSVDIGEGFNGLPGYAEGYARPVILKKYKEYELNDFEFEAEGG